jgi:hypothetical protein
MGGVEHHDRRPVNDDDRGRRYDHDGRRDDDRGGSVAGVAAVTGGASDAGARSAGSGAAGGRHARPAGRRGVAAEAQAGPTVAAVAGVAHVDVRRHDGRHDRHRGSRGATPVAGIPAIAGRAADTGAGPARGDATGGRHSRPAGCSRVTAGAKAGAAVASIAGVAHVHVGGRSDRHGNDRPEDGARGAVACVTAITCRASDSEAGAAPGHSARHGNARAAAGDRTAADAHADPAVAAVAGVADVRRL